MMPLLSGVWDVVKLINSLVQLSKTMLSTPQKKNSQSKVRPSGKWNPITSDNPFTSSFLDSTGQKPNRSRHFVSWSHVIAAVFYPANTIQSELAVRSSSCGHKSLDKELRRISALILQKSRSVWCCFQSRDAGSQSLPFPPFGILNLLLAISQVLSITA